MIEQPKDTLFKRIYDRGDLPVFVSFTGAARQLRWRVGFDLLDYSFYLPVFFSGLPEDVEPFKFMAHQGCLDLLRAGRGKVLQLVPQLVEPLREALEQERPLMMFRCLEVIRALVRSDRGVGEALVPYYRKLLGPVNKFFRKDLEVRVDGAHTPFRLNDYIDNTLADMEAYGGDFAFVNIKYMVPTYESHL